MPENSSSLFIKTYTFATYLAIVPPYDFQKQTLSGKHFKWYAAVIGVLCSTMELYLMSLRVQLIREFPTSIVVLDFMSESVSLLSYIIIIFHSVVVQANEWEELLSTVQDLEKSIQNKMKKSDKYLIGTIIITHVIFVSIIIFKFKTLAVFKRGYELTCTYIFLFAILYCIFIRMMIMITLMENLEQKFQNLNQNFKAMCTQKINFNLSCNGSIRRVGMLYKKVVHTTALYNKLFGYMIFFLFASTFFNLTLLLNLCVLSGSTGLNFEASRSVVLSSLFIAFCNIGATTTFVYNCEHLMAQSQNIADLCYSLEDRFAAASAERAELLRLAGLTESKKPVISAAGFFMVDKSSLGGLVGTTATYVIVLIQLNMIIP